MIAAFGEYSVGSLDRLRFSLVVLLEFRAKVGHLLRRVLQPGLLTGGIDGLFAGISWHAQDRVRIEHVFRIDGRRPGLLTALLLLLLSPARVLFPLAFVLLFPQTCFLFLMRPSTS